MVRIFEDKTCKTEYNSEKRRIKYVFDGYANVEENKQMYQQAMEFLKTNPT